ncbi:class I SAM-dependent methyltransferase [Nocardia goodfellowii]|uniref:SAM-dependent methyltransferase n=1 Tax=Nocardia goodfellowii TaxID=882446 RepID=A0ABS4Q7D0_9NOCA|nr:methyltransferase [Nocardia goodfellowii]MBP2187597.1 SAM-dependent methyltransferase [Nocardia goodfellowii]
MADLMAGDARFRWIADTMAVRPADRVLEIGPGSSDSIAAIAGRLDDGCYIGIDRSATAIARAAERHAPLLESVRVRMARVGLEQLRPDCVVDGIDFASAGFDKIVAVNVNLFWTKQPAAELTLIRQLLGSGGTLNLFYGYGNPDAAGSSPKPPPGKLVQHLAAADFTARTTTAGDLLGIIARPR